MSENIDPAKIPARPVPADGADPAEPRPTTGADPSEIPDEPPPAGGGEALIPDHPLGVDRDADPDGTGMPGLPEHEPPASG